MGWKRFAACGLVVAAAIRAMPALASCQPNLIADLPVTMRGTVPLIAAKINGHDVRFIADSGAFYSVISPDVADALKLLRMPSPVESRGVGGAVNRLDVATVRSFMLENVNVPNVPFLVGGSSFGEAGLLGQNVLGQTDVEYDLANGAIRLFRPVGCQRVALAYWAADKPLSMLPISPSDQGEPHIRGMVEVNGVKLRAIFDTGAGSTFIDIDAAARAGIKPSDDPKDAIVDRGIGPATSRGWRARVASVKLGDGEEIRNGWVRIGKLGIDGAADMLIGGDFFLSHRVFVANSQGRMYFTYNGGPAFGLAGDGKPVVAADDANTPGDADGYARRAAARMARGDGAGALADLDQAVAKAPDRADLLVERARMRFATNDLPAARADLDHALQRDPGNGGARLLRAQIEGRLHDSAAVLADLDAAAAAVPPQDSMRLAFGGLYTDNDAFDRAVAQYNLWIAAHRDDSHVADALNGRCWARALGNRDLAQALDDCNAALRRLPDDPGTLDSRGLVYLRLGQNAKARADYDAALKHNSTFAWSLYGRSLIEAGSDAAAAQKDRAAAIAIDPQLPAKAKRYGLAP